MPRDNQAYPPVSIADQGCQNVVVYRGEVRRENREKLLGHTSMVLWFTGLFGWDKSAIAHAVEERLHAVGRLPIHGKCLLRLRMRTLVNTVRANGRT